MSLLQLKTAMERVQARIIALGHKQDSDAVQDQIADLRRRLGRLDDEYAHRIECGKLLRKTA